MAAPLLPDTGDVGDPEARRRDARRRAIASQASITKVHATSATTGASIGL